MGEASVPKVVFHYTTGDGLLGILTSSTLWCTHFAYLNDSAEATYAYRVFYDALVAAGIPGGNPARNQVVSAVVAKLEAGPRRAREVYPWGDVFVASFSAAEDDLSQWRGYSSTGARYAIGFDRARLEAVGKAGKFDLRPVCCDAEEALRRMSPFVEQIIGDVPEAPKEGTVGIMTIIPPMDRALMNEGPWLKHPKFAAEREWRLATIPVDRGKVEFRAGKSYLIPYLKLELGSLDGLVKEIWVGPGPHPLENAAAVELLLTKVKWSPKGRPAIRSSNIPFRDW